MTNSEQSRMTKKERKIEINEGPIAYEPGNGQSLSPSLSFSPPPFSLFPPKGAFSLLSSNHV